MQKCRSRNLFSGLNLGFLTFVILPILLALLPLPSSLALSAASLYLARRCSNASKMVVGGGGGPDADAAGA